jgi:hypothetical protein
MSEQPPAVVAETAEREDLGRYLHSRHDEPTLWTPTGYRLTAVASVVALALLCFGARVLSLVVVPLTVFGYLWLRYRKLQVQGAYWVAMYERGVVVMTIMYQLPLPGRRLQWADVRAIRSDGTDQPAVMRSPAVALPIAASAPSGGRRGRPALAAGVVALAIAVPVALYATTAPRAAADRPWTAPSATPSPTESPSPIPSPVATVQQLPFTVDDYRQTCTLHVAYTGAAPYGGRGPHPTAFFPEMGSPDVLGPPAGQPAVDRLIASVQLVACVWLDTTDAASDGTANTCVYEGAGFEDSTVTMLWGHYKIDVYEARTARLLATLRVRLLNTKCPEVLMFVGGRAPALFSHSDGTEATAALRRYWQ